MPVKNIRPRRNFLKDSLRFLAGLSITGILAFLYEKLLIEDAVQNIVLDREGNTIEANSIDMGTLGFPGLLNDQKVLVFREGEKFRVLSGICTHKRCALRWDGDRQLIRCPCHGTRFNRNGEVVRGPAEKNLEKYNVVAKNGQLVMANE